ncbi:heterokaryon incompatibility, partial [Leptodontidium sp. 2 PMI_412]
AKLADNSQYEALSYAWGDPVFSHKIEFPGGYLSITEHLYTALMKLRDEYRPRRLWVDAICIDQTSDLEKGHQVALMADIYRGTERVL